MPDTRALVEAPLPHPRGAFSHIAAAAQPLPAFDDPAFGRLFDHLGDARVVLLGASTYGTAEFHLARAAITRWLVAHRGFNIVALEADGSDAAVLEAQVRDLRAAGAGRLARANRWVWRNREFDGFLSWLGEHNRRASRSDETRLHGLDLYDLSASLGVAVDYLERVEPEVARVARERFGGRDPWSQEPGTYGRMAVSGRYASCEGAVTSMLADRLQQKLREAPAVDGLSLAHGARLVRESEAHYRAMYYGGGEAWNRRATHMLETLQAILEARGPYARAVVWAHNAHVGDARATEMGMVRDELSLGQLCRQTWGEQARLIGLGAHAGTLLCAADGVDAAPTVKALRPSLPESQERQSHNAGLGRYLLDLGASSRNGVRRALSDPRIERFVGATYRPDTERWSHYAECRLSEQFDAWVWFDETQAVTPLDD